MCSELVQYLCPFVNWVHMKCMIWINQKARLCVYVCVLSTCIAPEQANESNRYFFFPPVNFTAVMYDQLSTIHKKTFHFFWHSVWLFTSWWKHEITNHHSKYYTSLYITYFNLSVLLQTAAPKISDNVKSLSERSLLSFISSSTMTAMSGYLSWSLFAWQMCLKLFSCCFAYFTWGSDDDEMFYLRSTDWEELGKQSFSVIPSKRSMLVSSH